MEAPEVGDFERGLQEHLVYMQIASEFAYRDKHRAEGIPVDDQARKRFEAHEAVKMQLRLRGSSLAEIGRSVGVSRTTVSLVGLRKLSVPKVEVAIAEALGVSVADLFEPIEKEL